MSDTEKVVVSKLGITAICKRSGRWCAKADRYAEYVVKYVSRLGDRLSYAGSQDTGPIRDVKCWKLAVYLPKYPASLPARPACSASQYVSLVCIYWF